MNDDMNLLPPPPQPLWRDSGYAPEELRCKPCTPYTERTPDLVHGSGCSATCPTAMPKTGLTSQLSNTLGRTHSEDSTRVTGQQSMRHGSTGIDSKPEVKAHSACRKSKNKGAVWKDDLGFTLPGTIREPLQEQKNAARLLAFLMDEENKNAGGPQRSKRMIRRRQPGFRTLLRTTRSGAFPVPPTLFELKRQKLRRRRTTNGATHRGCGNNSTTTSNMIGSHGLSPAEIQPVNDMGRRPGNKRFLAAIRAPAAIVWKSITPIPHDGPAYRQTHQCEPPHRRSLLRNTARRARSGGGVSDRVRHDNSFSERRAPAFELGASRDEGRQRFPKWLPVHVDSRSHGKKGGKKEGQWCLPPLENP